MGRWRSWGQVYIFHFSAGLPVGGPGQVTRTESPSLVEYNHRFHRMLVDGVDVSYRAADGRAIVQQQRAEGWGRSVVERLSADIFSEFPGFSGFSAGNIWRMRSFYLAWTEEAGNLQQPVGEPTDENLAQLAREMRSWGQVYIFHFSAGLPVAGPGRWGWWHPRRRMRCAGEAAALCSPAVVGLAGAVLSSNIRRLAFIIRDFGCGRRLRCGTIVRGPRW